MRVSTIKLRDCSTAHSLLYWSVGEGRRLEDFFIHLFSPCIGVRLGLDSLRIDGASERTDDSLEALGLEETERALVLFISISIGKSQV